MFYPTLLFMEEKNQTVKLDNETMLVDQAKTDDRAFAILYDFYFPKIYFFVFKRTGQKEVTEDIVSAVFIKIFTGLKTFKPNHDNSFAAWVYRIANNKLTDYYRSAHRHSTVDIASISEPRDDNQDPRADFIRQSNQIRVGQVLSLLPERDQAILQLKFFSELSNIEIAQALQTGPGNIGVWLYRALKRFQEIYQKYE